MSTEYIVMTAAAQMPSSCKGIYKKIAVCEVEAGVVPKMISARAKGMVRIVELWDRLHAGGGAKTTFATTLDRAQAYCARLNAGLLSDDTPSIVKRAPKTQAQAEREWIAGHSLGEKS